MTQRNPTNERYTSEERTGKTRKSAASAKPVSKAAASVHVQGKSSEQPKGIFARATKEANKKQRQKSGNKQADANRREQELRAKYYNADTPEYRKWRRIWWIMLAAAIACTALSFVANSREGWQHLTYVFISISYLLLFIAIVLDFTVIRKVRNAYVDKMIAEEGSKKNSAKRKAAAAAARQAAKEAEDAPPEEDRKPFRGLFTRKRASDAVQTAKSAQARAVGAADGADGADGAAASTAGVADASTVDDTAVGTAGDASASDAQPAD